VPKRGKAIVKTDIAISIPPNTYARIGLIEYIIYSYSTYKSRRLIHRRAIVLLCDIAPRSGLAVKHFIDVGAGVVDFDYRGNVGVVLFNHSEEDFVVTRGDRVAQLILECISMASVEEVEQLDDTARGASGFGSTGITTL